MGIWSLFRSVEEAQNAAFTEEVTPEIRAEGDDVIPPVIPSRAVSDTSVSTKDALGLSTVYRAVALKADAMRQLSVDVYNGSGNTQGLPLWLRKPGVNLSWRAFIEQTVVSLNLAGEAFWRTRRFGDSDKIETIEVLNPWDVQIRTSDAGRVIGYTHRGFDLGLDDVKHLSFLRVPGSAHGLGPIQAAQGELRGAIDNRDYSANWLRDNDIPSGVLSTDHVLTDQNAKAAKDNWTNTHGGQYGVAVLGGGLKYSPIFLDPATAQWIESRNASAVDVARMFGIPLSLLHAALDGTSLTYSNSLDEKRALVQYGLAREITEIEDALSDLLPRTQTARLNTEAFLRLSTDQRYAAHAAALAAGFMTPNEVREIEGLEPLPEAQTPEEGNND